MLTKSLYSEEERREIGIQRLGTFMLQGWVLTDSPCAKCAIPSMRRKDSSIVNFCVLCDNENDPILPCIPENETRDVALEEDLAEIDGDSYFVDFQENKTQPTISTMLGQKMLQGWTMMQDCCNQCPGVPLMRSRDMELFCVGCQRFINVDDTNEELVKEPSDDVVVLEKDVEDVAVLEKDVAKNKPEVDHKTAASSIVKAVKSESSSDSFDETVKALTQKIAYLTKKLKEKKNPQDITDYARSIQACAEALSSLQ